MEEPLRAVVIGCGAGGSGRGGSHSIGYAHGEAYRQASQVDLVAAADLNPTNLAHFADEFDLSESQTFTNHAEMLELVRPDLVSVCTWPPFHADMVTSAAHRGARGVWCEKPMALSLADADRMLEECRVTDTKLIVNHQRRYLEPFRVARDVIQADRIGDVLTIHAGIDGWDLLSWGTHWVDMFRFLLNDTSCEWVMAQFDTRSGQKKYGHPVEDHGVTCFAFENGTHAFLETGIQVPSAPALRIAGTKGLIDIHNSNDRRARGALRIMTPEHLGWDEPPLSEGLHSQSGFDRALGKLVGAVLGGPTPSISGESGRVTTEMIMAAYESARLRRRIELPLATRDFPLEAYAGLSRETMTSPIEEGDDAK